MLKESLTGRRVFIATGYTDMRRGIDGLAAIVSEEFGLDPFTESVYLFCGRRSDRMKCLWWERDGFVLATSAWKVLGHSSGRAVSTRRRP